MASHRPRANILAPMTPWKTALTAAGAATLLAAASDRCGRRRHQVLAQSREVPRDGLHHVGQGHGRHMRKGQPGSRHLLQVPGSRTAASRGTARPRSSVSRARSRRARRSRTEFDARVASPRRATRRWSTRPAEPLGHEPVDGRPQVRPERGEKKRVSGGCRPSYQRSADDSEAQAAAAHVAGQVDALVHAARAGRALVRGRVVA